LSYTYHIKYHCQVWGGMMLGYTKIELDEMINSVGTAHDYTTDETVSDGLAKTYAFLNGLWAEGYFD